MPPIENPPPALVSKAIEPLDSPAQFSNLAEKSYSILLPPGEAAKLIGISGSYLARLRAGGELVENVHYVRHGDRCYRYLSDALYHWAKTRHQLAAPQLLRPEEAAQLLAISRSYLARLRAGGELVENVHYVRRGQRCYRYLANSLYDWAVNRRRSNEHN